MWARAKPNGGRSWVPVPAVTVRSDGSDRYRRHNGLPWIASFEKDVTKRCYKTCFVWRLKNKKTDDLESWRVAGHVNISCIGKPEGRSEAGDRRAMAQDCVWWDACCVASCHLRARCGWRSEFQGPCKNISVLTRHTYRVVANF